MKKYFISSDIHGFYTYFKKALERSGFDINNPDHILIICGDLFDRGKEPIELYTFIRSLPKDRRILVRGNHEYLLLDLIRNNGDYNYYDIANGTYGTWCELNKQGLLDEVKNWILSDEWVNYYELNNYIFVHSFIPTSILDKEGYWYEYDPNWREDATSTDWNKATWGCPYLLYEDGLFDEEIKQNKILVCGHWHTSDFYNHLDPKYINGKRKGIKNNPIYLSDHLIALDACTALTLGVNILTLENSKLTCYNYNNKMEN